MPAKLIDETEKTSGSPFSAMGVGETRTMQLATAMDERGRVNPETRRPKTITRTDRPFIYDWVDSTNDELAQRQSPYRWMIVNGEPKLMDVEQARRHVAHERQYAQELQARRQIQSASRNLKA
jgi:hypothetical protein